MAVALQQELPKGVEAPALAREAIGSLAREVPAELMEDARRRARTAT